MKTFFSLLFSWRPWRAFQSLRWSKERIELEAFEKADPVLFFIRPARGFSKRKFSKDLKNILKSTHRFPAKLRISESCFETMSDKEYFDMVWKQSCFEIIYIGGDLGKSFSKKLSTMDGGRLEWRSIQISSYHSWGDIETLTEMLQTILNVNWFKVQQHLGKVPTICDSCKESLRVTQDLRCNSCSVDIGAELKAPKTLYKLYEEICTYEKNSGKDILKRAA